MTKEEHEEMEEILLTWPRSFAIAKLQKAYDMLYSSMQEQSSTKNSSFLRRKPDVNRAMVNTTLHHTTHHNTPNNTLTLTLHKHIKIRLVNIF